MNIPLHAVDGFVADYCDFIRYFLRNPNRENFAEDRHGNSASPVAAAIVESVEAYTIVDIATLTAAVARVCWRSTNRLPRALSPDEIHAEAAAWRLSDALNEGRRVSYRPRFVRSDGSSD
jgi:hypothetical protein